MSRWLSIRVTEIAVLTSNPLGKMNADNSGGGDLYSQENSIIPWCKTIIRQRMWTNSFNEKSAEWQGA